nr:DegT/DnrJ/EryC1/StrS family aminotransferase [uncultured Schaedlerella sp.]
MAKPAFRGGKPGGAEAFEKNIPRGVGVKQSHPLQNYGNERKRVSEVLTEAAAKSIREEPRFRGIKQFHNRRAEPAAPILYGEALEYASKALEPGAAGEHAEALEEETARLIGVKHGTAFSSGTAALHMAVRLAAEKIYGSGNCGVGCGNAIFGSRVYGKGGALSGRRVFCSDLTSSAMVNPVLYEGGEPIFIDASPWDWGMDPEALELAFDRYPDVKLVIMVHIYGFPGQVRKVKEICEKHGALLIEDACESFGAAVDGKQTGSFGDYGVLSFGNGQLMTGTGGGMLLTNDSWEDRKARRLETQSLSSAFGCRDIRWIYGAPLGDAAAGIIRGQMKHLDAHIAKKKAIYERYEEHFSEDMMLLNPIGKGTKPNYRMSCMTVESSIIFKETRSEREYEYQSQHGTAAPMEILDALEAFGIEGRPLWKPMHMQPVFRNCDQITLDGSRREYEKTKQDDFWIRSNESGDIFRNGLCLPSDVRMTEEEQERVIDIVVSCYNRREMDRGLWCAI